jgi:hypothetical protein
MCSIYRLIIIYINIDKKSRVKMTTILEWNEYFSMYLNIYFIPTS